MTMASKHVEATVQDLLRRPYRKVITGDSEEGFLAMVPELPGCFTAGETEQEALELLHDAMAGWIESAIERGLPIPEPAGQESGKVLVRMPKSLHRRLLERAEQEGVSANQLAVAILARGL
jgi:antitoxin HicB